MGLNGWFTHFIQILYAMGFYIKYYSLKIFIWFLINRRDHTQK